MNHLENISVVIPYKKNQYLENILKQIKGKFKEIIIVGDKIEGLNEFTEIKFIPGNYNAAKARNIGAKYATQEYIFFLDSDCSPIIEKLETIDNFNYKKKKNSYWNLFK